MNFPSVTIHQYMTSIKTPCTLNFYNNHNNNNYHHEENKNDNWKKKKKKNCIMATKFSTTVGPEYRPFRLHQIDPHLVVGEGSQHSPKYLHML